MDDLTPEQRRRNMRAIRSKDTSIELLLRKALWQEGIRYRKNYNKLPGKPDIAITKYHVAVFCDSDFWHGYDWANRNQRIKSNRDYWIPKIERNMERDQEVTKRLQEDGWIVLRFWEWQLKKHLDECVKAVKESIAFMDRKVAVCRSQHAGDMLTTQHGGCKEYQAKSE